MRLPFGPHRTIDVVATLLIAIVVALTAASMTGASQSPATSQDPVIGQWRLDVSKSKVHPRARAEERDTHVSVDGGGRQGGDCPDPPERPRRDD